MLGGGIKHCQEWWQPWTARPWESLNPHPQYKVVVCILTVCWSGCASLFSVCREGQRRCSESLIDMDPQTHTHSTLTYPFSTLAPRHSNILPQCGGVPTGTPTPTFSLSKGIPAPHTSHQGWMGCYEPPNFSGCLPIVHWVPSWVRNPHGAVSQVMLLWWPWVHLQLWGLGVCHQG